MKGWKTWLGAALTVGTGVLKFTQDGDTSFLVGSIAAALGLVGIGHKIEKNGTQGS